MKWPRNVLQRRIERRRRISCDHKLTASAAESSGHKHNINTSQESHSESAHHNNNNISPAQPKTYKSTTKPMAAKFDRLPEVLRDTMEWVFGRSRRKGVDGKENAHQVTTGVQSGQPHATTPHTHCQTHPSKQRHATAAYPYSGQHAVRASHSTEFSVCDSLNTAQYTDMVRLPPGMHTHEWLAMHSVSFFHHVNALYGVVSEYCTADQCPVMTCGPCYSQLPWVDDKGKKWKYAAPQYIDCVMTLLEGIVQSEEGYPTKYGQAFPPSFDQLVRRVIRLLWHVLGHVCYEHEQHLRASGVRAQCAAVLQHLHAFCSLFTLLDPKDLAAVNELCVRWAPPPPLSATQSANQSKTCSLPPMLRCTGTERHHQSATALQHTTSFHCTTPQQSTTGTKHNSVEDMDCSDAQQLVSSTTAGGRKADSWGGQSATSVCRMTHQVAA